MPDWLKRISSSRSSGTAALSNDAPASSLRYVVLDTELTSLDHRTNRLLSVGAMAMDGPSIQLGEQFYRVVNPGIPIPAETIVIHKLRVEDVETAEPLEKTLVDFRRFIEGAILVGHFVNIELNILQKEMAQTGHKLDNPAVDTARVQNWILRHGTYSEDLSLKLEKMDLLTLAKFYEVEVSEAHHALSDAFLTARVWQRMLRALQARRIDTLGKLLRIGGV